MFRIVSLLLLTLSLSVSGAPTQTPAKKTFLLDYTIELLPKQDQARIRIDPARRTHRSPSR